MTCAISALVCTDGNEVFVVEVPCDVPSGCRVIGEMRFVDGQCEAKSSEKTLEVTLMMAVASQAFAQIVAMRLRERPDYRAQRQRILDMPSPPMMA